MPYHSALHDSDNVDHAEHGCPRAARILDRCDCEERRPAARCSWCYTGRIERDPAQLDHERHYATLAMEHPAWRASVVCGSGADVDVSQALGAFTGSIEEIDGAVRFDPEKGPLFIECSKHGMYLGYWRLLPRAGGAAFKPLSIPLLLIPLRDVEHVIPLYQAP